MAMRRSMVRERCHCFERSLLAFEANEGEGGELRDKGKLHKRNTQSNKINHCIGLRDNLQKTVFSGPEKLWVSCIHVPEPNLGKQDQPIKSNRLGLSRNSVYRDVPQCALRVQSTQQCPIGHLCGR